MDPAQPLPTPSPRKGSGAPVRTCVSLLLSRFQAVQPPQTSCPLFFFHPAIPEVTCPREGAQASLAGAGQSWGGSPGLAVRSPAWASSSPCPASSRGDFPAGRAQGTVPATCCGSRALLRARTAAGGGRRWHGEWDLLGPAPGPDTLERARGAGPLVTRPPHTALPPPLTTCYCLATTRTKCRSGEQIFPLSQLQCRG